MKGSRWIPIYGMFTKDINSYQSSDIEHTAILILYHGATMFALFGAVIFLSIQ